MEKINSGDEEKSLFPEHDFIVSCLRIGLSLNDLKILTYIDVMKILLSYIKPSKKNSTKTASQRDIDRLLG